MSAKWLPPRIACFDVESTGVNVASDHIVTAHMLYVGAQGLESEESWLINPGVDIPEAATAIHGITNDMVRQSGTPLHEGIPAIGRSVREAWAAGVPIIACNATFDLTMLDNELDRCAHTPLKPGPVLDPLAIDRAADPYRKGKRTLAALAAYYRVKQGDAHNSREDALTAARIVWAQAKAHVGLASMTLEQMQAFQRVGHERWARGMGEWLVKQRKPNDVESEWPIRAREAA